VSDDLASRLRAELGRRFPEVAMTLGTGSEVAHIPCPSGSIGDVLITYEEGLYDQFTIFVEGMTHFHVHFAAYDGEDDIVVDCCNFLDDVFHDRMVIWCRPDGSDGGALLVEDLDPWQLPLRARPGRVRMATWSVPMKRVECPGCGTNFTVMPSDLYKTIGDQWGIEGELTGDRLAVADVDLFYTCPDCGERGQLPPEDELQRLAENSD
jgi:hypothetical protein